VSERERLYIASHYEIIGTGNLDAARKVYELSAQTYPHDTPFTNLGLIYSELGDHDKAITAYRQAISINSGTGSRYANLIGGYLHLNRLDEAKATALEAQAHNIDSPRIHLSSMPSHSSSTTTRNGARSGRTHGQSGIRGPNVQRRSGYGFVWRTAGPGAVLDPARR
jgi:tetratricopeptide (TPR) repeat protein